MGCRPAFRPSVRHWFSFSRTSGQSYIQFIAALVNICQGKSETGGAPIVIWNSATRELGELGGNSGQTGRFDTYLTRLVWLILEIFRERQTPLRPRPPPPSFAPNVLT